MTWARLDDGVNSNPKITALTADAFRLWVSGLVYAQHHLTDGHVPEHALQTFPGRRTTAVIRELTISLVARKAPLWHVVEGGYQIHDYLDWNDSADDISKARELGRERLARFRGKRRTDHVSKRVTERVTEHVSERVQNGVETSSTPLHTTTTPQEDQNPDPRPKVARLTADYSGLFEGFWAHYPNRTGKGAAFKAWKSIGPNAELVVLMMEALDWQRNQPQWTKDGGRFVPHPATWLNQRRWEDEPFHGMGESDDEQFERVLAGKGVVR